jgi:PAS domain S-box-containing protein
MEDAGTVGEIKGGFSTRLSVDQIDSLGARLMAALSFSPESGADTTKLRNLLLIALAIVFFFEAGSTGDTWFHSGHWSMPLYIRGLNLALTTAAIWAVSCIRFNERWRWWAVLFCTVIAVDSAFIGFVINQDHPLQITLVVLMIDTALLVPWGARWQGSLGLVCLTAVIVSAVHGIIDVRDQQGWLIVVAATAFAICFSALKKYYSDQMLLIASLRAEGAQREAAQRVAQQGERTLRKIIDASFDVIMIYDLEADRVLDINKAFEIFGFTREEIIGKREAELDLWVDPGDLGQIQKGLQANGQIEAMEVRLHHPGGRLVDYLMSAAVVELNGRPCSVSIGHDITERTRMEHELITAREAALAASRSKSEFLSSMSHEIRTPMNAVLGMAELLSETELSDEQRRYLKVMASNGDTLLELINSILDMAKIEAGRMQMEKVDFDLTDLIEKTMSTLSARAHSKGLELAARIAPGVPEYLVGDPLRLRQILINLLGNAIKFTEAGEIILEVDRAPGAAEPGSLRFTVADSGIGIARDQVDAIFANFTQADSSTTRQYGGTGLGLAIAQRLVGLMDGRIWLESEVGKGSKFSFTARFGLAPRMLSPKADVVLSLAGYRVLVVDDNQINRLIAGEMTAGCGAEVTEADSGAAALAEMRRTKQAGRPYDIVLLDMRMPGMDGLAVARCIREEQLALAPFILMLSSDDVKPQLARLGELGLDAYLVKPITRKELFAAIHRLLEQANRRGANALPASSVAAAPAPEQIPARRPTRILVAEDSADNRLLISAYLRREPYQVDFAEDGEQAVAQFLAHDDYDLIFMDIQMPRMDGLDATSRIRQLEGEHARRPLPIIALTASALEEDVARALAAGCNLHLSKPMKKRMLLDAIRNAAFISVTSESSTAASPPPLRHPDCPSTAPTAPRATTVRCVNNRQI